MNRTSESLTLRFADVWSRIAPKSLGNGVLVAVSGGVDSMALADLTHKAGIPLAVAHVNFGLRADASDGDEAFVRAWAAERKLPFYGILFDTKLEAAARRKGVQETARDLRYEWFEKVRAEGNYGAILTAHHAGDNAETFLINLFRGAGIAGLGGIPEMSKYLRRPLIHFRKEELTEYAEKEGISFHEDASNAGNDYLRNAVRHKLMPVLDELFPDPIARLSATSSRLREAGQLYEEAVNRRVQRLIDPRGADLYIPVRKLRYASPLNTICHEIFSPANFLPTQIPQIISLMDGETGRFVASPTHWIIRHRDHLVLTAVSAGESELILIDELPSTVSTSLHTFEFSLQKPPRSFGFDPETAWLDASQLKGALVLRVVKAGDYFYPFGMEQKKKKVARFFTSLKMPRHEKEAAWILESGSRIAWVAGYRIDERFRITERTEKALRVVRSRR